MSMLLGCGQIDWPGREVSSVTAATCDICMLIYADFPCITAIKQRQ